MDERKCVGIKNTTEVNRTFWTSLTQELSQNDKIDSWPFMSSPWPVIALFLFYLHFSIISGPKIIQNRRPINFKMIVVFHNVIQIVLNGSLVFYCFWITGFASFVIDASCEHPKVFPRSADEVFHLNQFHRGGWYFLVSKVLDLLDTVFIVIAKKSSKISFLHVYHHSTMLLVVWFGFKYIRPIYAVFPSVLNSLVHVFMYTYYLISIIVPGFGRKHEGIKKAITLFQLAQFVAIIIYCVAHSSCPVPKIMIYVLLFQDAIFLVLSSNFFIQTYLKDEKSRLKPWNQKKKVS